MVAAFATGHLDDVEAYVADAYLDHQGLGSPLTGPSGFRSIVQAARSAGALDVWIEDLIVAKDRAAARLRWRRTPEGADVIERETIDIIRVQAGQAVEHWGAESWSRTVPRATRAV
jgi:hypothetical protein